MNVAFILLLFLGTASADESAPLSALFDGRGMLEEFAKIQRESTFFPSGLDAVRHITFNEDGNRILMAGSGALAGPWNPKRPEEIRTTITTQSVGRVAFSQTGSRVIFGIPGQAMLYEVKAGAMIGSYKIDDYRAAMAAFSPDGSQAALFGLFEPWLTVVDAATGKVAKRLHVNQRGVATAFFSVDNRTLTTIDFAGKAEQWDLDSKWPFGRAKGLAVVAPPTSLNGAFFSRDRSMVALDLIDHVDIRNTNDWTKLASIPLGGDCTVESVSFSPDRRQLAIIPWQYCGAAAVWDVETGRKLRSLNPKARAVAFSPDGDYLMLGLDDGGQVEMIKLRLDADELAAEQKKFADFLSTRSVADAAPRPEESAEERFKLK